MNTTNAGRNRTITINENEIHKLKQSISYIENINSELGLKQSSFWQSLELFGEQLL